MGEKRKLAFVHLPPKQLGDSTVCIWQQFVAAPLLLKLALRRNLAYEISSLPYSRVLDYSTFEFTTLPYPTRSWKTTTRWGLPGINPNWAQLPTGKRGSRGKDELEFDPTQGRKWFCSMLILLQLGFDRVENRLWFYGQILQNVFWPEFWTREDQYMVKPGLTTKRPKLSLDGRHCIPILWLRTSRPGGKSTQTHFKIKAQ